MEYYDGDGHDDDEHCDRKRENRGKSSNRFRNILFLFAVRLLFFWPLFISPVAEFDVQNGTTRRGTQLNLIAQFLRRRRASGCPSPPTKGNFKSNVVSSFALRARREIGGSRFALRTV